MGRSPRDGKVLRQSAPVKRFNLLGLMAVNRRVGRSSRSAATSPSSSCSIGLHRAPRSTAGRQCGHFESTCYHSLLLFNQHGDCLAAKLPGNVSSAEEGRVAAARDRAPTGRWETRDVPGRRSLRQAGDLRSVGAAWRGLCDSHAGQQEPGVGDRRYDLFRPPGRPSAKPLVRYKSFRYQAASWSKPRRPSPRSRFIPASCLRDPASS